MIAVAQRKPRQDGGCDRHDRASAPWTHFFCKNEVADRFLMGLGIDRVAGWPGDGEPESSMTVVEDGWPQGLQQSVM